MDAGTFFRAIGHDRTNRLFGSKVRARVMGSACGRPPTLVAGLVYGGSGGGERQAGGAMSPTVSVIIPCYNAAAYIEETLGSAYSQQGVELEKIVVDDGSNDDRAHVVACRFSSVLIKQTP